MAEKQLNAPVCAESGVLAAVAPSGVIHVRHRHQDRFTVVGNHLAQNRRLSCVAIGLAVHIMSLPDGAKVGVKVLAGKFTEGEVVIAAGLRQLEAHGYLVRVRERTAGGRWVTRTIMYDMPLTLAEALSAGAGAGAAGVGTAGAAGRVQRPAPKVTPKPTPKAELRRSPVQVPVSAPVPVADELVSVPVPVAEPAPEVVSASASAVSPVPVPARVPAPASAPVPAPAPVSGLAVAVLSGLRRVDARLLLSEREIVGLSGAVSTWLERGVDPVSVQRALTTMLPQDPIPHPAALLAYRLADKLPPPLPATRTTPGTRRPDPLQNCDTCDHAFRAPDPGNCPGCEPPPAVAQCQQ